MKLLLLGGTAEARHLAEALHTEVDVVSSLAGRVPDPALPVGRVRVGGFGGAESMRRWLLDECVDAVVDATHPFAAAITARTAQVCATLGLPHLVLARPAWDPERAHRVASTVAAALAVEQQGFSRIFLTSGRSGVAAFKDSAAWFLIRVVTEPDPDTLPPRREVVLSRGPYSYGDELTLMREYHIDALVTKNSGGNLTRAKLDVAAELGVAVVMIDRPALPDNVTAVPSVEAAARWVRAMRRS